MAVVVLERRWRLFSWFRHDGCQNGAKTTEATAKVTIKLRRGSTGLVFSGHKTAVVECEVKQPTRRLVFTGLHFDPVKMADKRKLQSTCSGSWEAAVASACSYAIQPICKAHSAQPLAAVAFLFMTLGCLVCINDSDVAWLCTAEIDRCLKQVAEHLEVFEDTWDKVARARSDSQLAQSSTYPTSSVANRLSCRSTPPPTKTKRRSLKASSSVKSRNYRCVTEAS